MATQQSGKRTRGEVHDFDHQERNVRMKRDPEIPIATIKVLRKEVEVFHEKYRGDGNLIEKSYTNWWYGYMTLEAENVFRKWLDKRKLGVRPNEEHEVTIYYDEALAARVREFGDYNMMY